MKNSNVAKLSVAGKIADYLIFFETFCIFTAVTGLSIIRIERRLKSIKV